MATAPTWEEAAALERAAAAVGALDTRLDGHPLAAAWGLRARSGSAPGP